MVKLDIQTEEEIIRDELFIAKRKKTPFNILVCNLKTFDIKSHETTYESQKFSYDKSVC